MRCLFCGKRLALLRKLTDGEFCSTAHRKRYLEEEQKLALARLIDEQNRPGKRRAAAEPARPASADRRVQEVAGFRTQQPAARFKPFSPVAPPSDLHESVSPQFAERQGQSPVFSKALPVVGGPVLECAGAPTHRHPVSSSTPDPEPSSSVAVCLGLAGATVLAVSPLTPAELVVLEPASGVKDSRRLGRRRKKTSVFLKQLSPVSPRAVELGPAQPVAVPPLASAPVLRASDPAAKVAPPVSAGVVPAVALKEPESGELRTTGIAVGRTKDAERIEAIERLAPEAAWRLRAAAPGGPAVMTISPAGEKPEIPPRCPVPPLRISAPAPSAAPGPMRSEPAPSGSWRRLPDAADAGPLPGCVSAFLAPPERRGGVWKPETARTGPVRVEPRAVPLSMRLEAHPAPTGFSGRVAWMPVPGLGAAAFRGRTSARCAAVKPLPCRIETRLGMVAPIPSTAPVRLPARPGRLESAIRPCLPFLRVAVQADPLPGTLMAAAEVRFEPLALSPWQEVRRPVPSWLRSQAVGNELLEPRVHLGARRPAPWSPAPPLATSFATRPLSPRVRMQTVQEKRRAVQLPQAPKPASAPSRHVRLWKAAPHFWKNAPADLKWISVALPAILLVTLISAVGWLPSKQAQAPRSGESARSGSFESAVHQRWALVQQNIAERAAINLQDDFRSGLAEWEGLGNWAKDWQYDPAGFILTGDLALYRPSRDLTDYRFEFLGQIDRKSLNWVFRAADHKNYYAMKIVLLKSAPLPTATLLRYAVIDGKPERPVQTRLPLSVRSDMFYRVRVDVRDQDFTTTVQGQIVDFWSDRRLGRGGVGFFSEKGERARLRWMEVSHQYDTLGRLCALLAPYNMQSGNGSLSRQ